MTMAPPASLLAAAALAAGLLAGCPQLESPVATVTGRIFGGSAAGYVYPLGRPDLKVALQADGSYRLDGVPTSIDEFVLFDGGAPSVGRAERVHRELEGGAMNRIDDRYGFGATWVSDAQKMPLAGTVLAAAIPDGGAAQPALAFTIPETEHEGVIPSSPGSESVAIYPLPAGGFEVDVGAPGFKPAVLQIQVLAGATALAQLRLDVDLAAAEPGCAATGSCEHGLHCRPSDGRCYACTVATVAADCNVAAGESCDTTLGLCLAPALAGAGTVCASCASGADCLSGFFCVVETGAPSGYCSRGCAASTDCPAGFSCDGLGRCVAPSGCSDWLQTMASLCVDASACTDLSGGVCTASGGTPGICTAPCKADADCRIGAAMALATCNMTTGLCAPP